MTAQYPRLQAARAAEVASRDNQQYILNNTVPGILNYLEHEPYSYHLDDWLLVVDTVLQNPDMLADNEGATQAYALDDKIMGLAMWNAKDGTDAASDVNVDTMGDALATAWATDTRNA